MTCRRCGISTPLLYRDQRYCPQCSREVESLLRRDAERRRPRFERARDMTEVYR